MDEPTKNNKTKPKNNKNLAKNNKSKNNKSKNTSNNKETKTQKEIGLSYNKNVPMLIITAIFFFFVMYNLLKFKRDKEDVLREKIDREIRKKLYFTDIY